MHISDRWLPEARALPILSHDRNEKKANSINTDPRNNSSLPKYRYSSRLAIPPPATMPYKRSTFFSGKPGFQLFLMSVYQMSQHKKRKSGKQIVSKLHNTEMLFREQEGRKFLIPKWIRRSTGIRTYACLQIRNLAAKAKRR